MNTIKKEIPGYVKTYEDEKTTGHTGQNQSY